MSMKHEFTAKTVEEAVEAGLTELGVSISDVEVQVLEEGSKGLFGLFGSRPAKISMMVKEAMDDPLSILEPVSKLEPKAEKKPVDKAEPKAERPAPIKREPKQQAAEPAEKAQPAREERPRKERAPKPERKEQPAKVLPPKTPVQPLVKPVFHPIEADALTADSPAGQAKAFLSELTGLMGVQVDIAMGADDEGNISATMTGDTLGILIGRRGETLDALQYLTSLQVNRGREGYVRVTLDSEDYRAKREDTLIRLANRMANRAVRTGRKVVMEPMNPYERRIIHSAIQANEAVETHSEGEEPNRHVVITIRK